MRAASKIIVSQIVSLVLAYFAGQWIVSLVDKLMPAATGFPLGDVAVFVLGLVYIYLLLIVSVSNLWFVQISKWNYLIPAILVLIFPFFDNNKESLVQGLVYWLFAFLGGWILAWVVNFVAGLVKK